jgi:adenylylsulfate kinase
MPYTEKHSRSLAKAISYRLLSVSMDLLIVFTITKKAELTLGIVVISNVVSIFLYYFHERIWNKFHFGRKLTKPTKH